MSATRATKTTKRYERKKKKNTTKATASKKFHGYVVGHEKVLNDVFVKNHFLTEMVLECRGATFKLTIRFM